MYRCYIEREKNIFGASYSLCADLENGSGRELIVCKKLGSNRTSHYVFSLKNEDLSRKPEQRSKLYLGKLRQIDDGTYVLYDAGACKAEKEDNSGVAYDEKMFTSASLTSTTSSTSSTATAKVPTDTAYRKELCVVHYSSTRRPQKDDERACQVITAGITDMSQTY
jgi:hypothetical protein